MSEKDLGHRELLRFAAYRSDAEFLGRYVERAGDLLPIIARISSDMIFNTELDFIAKVGETGLLPETVRLAAVERITDLCLRWADAEPFRDAKVRALFTQAELADLSTRFRTEIVEEYGRYPSRWNDQFTSGDRPQLMRDLKESIETFSSFYPENSELATEAAAAAKRIEEFADSLEEDEEDSSASTSPVTPTLSPTDQLATIFDDVDD